MNRHLISAGDLSREDAILILDTAEELARVEGQAIRKLPTLRGLTVVNLFYEDSTRTRTSFEAAAKRLSADVINFSAKGSSVAKGESLKDTALTLEAMGADAVVIRHPASGAPRRLTDWVSGRVVNAGDGHRAHPTQGLLDVLTIRQHRPDFENLVVVICGDIKHSRVARSDIHALTVMGAKEIRLCGPAGLMPAADEFPHCRYYNDFDAAIEGADVSIMLRLQKERMASVDLPDEAAYFNHYGLDTRRLARAAKGCLVMHPGPLNRGIEIASEVADGAQSRILEQVGNGVFVRMAVLCEVLAR